MCQHQCCCVSPKTNDSCPLCLCHLHWTFGSMNSSAPMDPNWQALMQGCGHGCRAFKLFLVPVCACFCLVAANVGICVTTTWATGPSCKVLPLIGFSDDRSLHSTLPCQLNHSFSKMLECTMHCWQDKAPLLSYQCAKQSANKCHKIAVLQHHDFVSSIVVCS